MQYFRGLKRSVVMSMAAVMLFTTAAIAAETYVVDQAHSSVEFAIKHLVISTVKGRFGTFEGTLTLDPNDPTKSSLGGVIQAKSIDTNNSSRDDHLRNPDFFDVEKYPEITFLSRQVVKKGSDYVFTGLLSMHGVDKIVSVPCRITEKIVDPRGNTKRGFSGIFEINRDDWDLTYNQAMETGGFLIGKNVKIELNFELTLQKTE